MPTTTITPIPVNSGTLTLKNRSDMTYVHMGAGKFLMFYSQRNPNLVYAYVVNVTGLNTASPVSTNGPQFAFPSSNGNVRAWKMAANRVLVLLGNDLRVIDIDGSDNLTLRAANLPNAYNVNYLWKNSGGVDNSDTNDMGSMITATSLSDNVMMVFKRGTAFTTQANTNTSYYCFKITFDPVADTLTSVSQTSGNIHGAVSSSGHSRIIVKDIPNTTEKMITTPGSEGNSSETRNSNTVRLKDVRVMNADGLYTIMLHPDNNGTMYYSAGMTQVSSAGTKYSVHFVLPINRTTYIGFHDGCSFLTHTGSTPFASAKASVSPSDGTGSWNNYNKFSSSGEYTMVNDAILIDQYHALVLLTAPIVPTLGGGAKTAKEASGSSNFLRVVRFVDPNFTDVSSQTKVYNSIDLGVALSPDQPNMLHKVDENCFVFLSKKDTTEGNMQVVIKAIRAA